MTVSVVDNELWEVTRGRQQQACGHPDMAGTARLSAGEASRATPRPPACAGAEAAASWKAARRCLKLDGELGVVHCAAVTITHKQTDGELRKNRLLSSRRWRSSWIKGTGNLS